MLCLLSECAEHACVGARAAIAALLIDRVAFEAAHLERAVDLRGDEVPLQRRVCATAVHDGLFAALDRAHNIEEQVVLDQWREVLKQLLFDGLLFGSGRLGSGVLARWSAIRLVRLFVVADRTSLGRWRRSVSLSVSDG
jgi:hypothetical protein